MEKREDWNPEDSSQPQLGILHNVNWEEYTVSLFLEHQWISDSGGLRIAWGAYFGAMLINVSCKDYASKEIPPISSLTDGKEHSWEMQNNLLSWHLVFTFLSTAKFV